ncbi:hypothetical protein OH77DRAFT_1375933, partial [Trametes cingulata]
MNPPTELPPQFNPLAHAANRVHASSTPASTEDTTAGQHFSRPFSIDEIDAVKDHIRRNCKGAARGLDGIGYDDVLAIPSQQLLDLFQACITEGKSYRTIGLESCLLKTLTLLIDRRLRKWADATGRLPDLQSGFRHGHHTYNNAFVLRSAIEAARAQGRTLYVVFLDLANAFPSIDQPTLWAKLAHWGASGPLLD